MEDKKETKEKLNPEARLEVVKVLRYFANLNVTGIAKNLGVDVSTISRDLKKIGKDLTLNPVNLDELSSILQFRAEKRQQELMKIYQKSSNPHVKIGCLKNMREEDKCLIDILQAMTKLYEAPALGETINYISHIPQPQKVLVEVNKIITDKREDLPEYQ